MTSLVAFTSALFFSVSTPVTRQLGILESNVFANYQLLGSGSVTGAARDRHHAFEDKPPEFFDDCPPGQVLSEVEGGRPYPM
jgi:hypothetical protein